MAWDKVIVRRKLNSNGDVTIGFMRTPFARETKFCIPLKYLCPVIRFAKTAKIVFVGKGRPRRVYKGRGEEDIALFTRFTFVPSSNFENAVVGALGTARITGEEAGIIVYRSGGEYLFLPAPVGVIYTLAYLLDGEPLIGFVKGGETEEEATRILSFCGFDPTSLEYAKFLCMRGEWNDERRQRACVQDRHRGGVRRNH